MKYQVKIIPSREEFAMMPFLDRRIYEETARQRFSLLSKEYVLKKYQEEKFPVEGNRLLGSYLKSYLERRKLDSVTLLDIGSAGGALSTIFALDAIERQGLLPKTKVILADISHEALEATKKGDFELPEEFIQENGLSRFGNRGERFKEVLRDAELYVADGTKLPKEIGNIDVCITGFTHHHMNLLDKELACREMERVSSQGAFIGVVDESLSYEDYLAWLDHHKEEVNQEGEPVPIAQESFISIDEHMSFFSNALPDRRQVSREYYCFSLEKK